MIKLPNKILIHYAGAARYFKARSTKRAVNFWDTTPNDNDPDWFVMDTSNSNPLGNYYVWWCPTRKDARDLVKHHKSANLAALGTPVKYYFHSRKAV
jgi:hypothetical protein